PSAAANQAPAPAPSNGVLPIASAPEPLQAPAEPAPVAAPAADELIQPDVSREAVAELAAALAGGTPALESAAVRTLPVTRPTSHWPLPPAYGAGSSYVDRLPVIYHDNDFLARYLLIFEAIWEPLEQRQDFIDMYFDPYTTPAEFLPWLASWIDLDLNTHWPEARQRQLLAEATELYRWRGTRYELTRIIEICTGLTPEILEDPAQPFIFRVRLQIPAHSSVDLALVEDLVRTHKPAHAGYILELQP
ncbi:MAG: phage tail protein I, partial [Roseiflexaceae bacterium]|nr:phage tail protein I [Roseiflexaceae bacterium]